MNIVAIQTFLSVVRSRNLNRAADEMNITQSAVTARLDALEQAMGVRLLIRSRKGAELTKAGFAFLEQAEVITRTWSNARARANLPQGVTGVFSFACDPGLWSGMGADWIDDIRRRSPETAIEIWSGATSEARGWLQSGICDAALSCEPVVGAGVETREFAVDELIQVASRPRDVVKWDPDYIYVDYGPTIRAQHAETWLGDETAAMTFDAPDWALAHLLQVGGSAYLPRRLVAQALDQAQLFEVQGAAAFTRRCYLSWRKNSEASFDWLRAEYAAQR